MIARCIFPFHQATLLQHWIVSNRAWPLSSPGCRHWNWTRINWIPPLWECMATKQIYFYVSFRALGVKTYPAKSARNLGVIFDKNFHFRSHISTICSSCIYHIRDLWRIRRHLDLDSTKLLANALVSSRLDYWNLQKLTSPSSNIFWTIWLVWSQSHHHLLPVFHCCAPFIGY